MEPIADLKFFADYEIRPLKGLWKHLARKKPSEETLFSPWLLQVALDTVHWLRSQLSFKSFHWIAISPQPDASTRAVFFGTNS